MSADRDRHSERCPRCGQFVETVEGGHVPLDHFDLLGGDCR